MICGDEAGMTTNTWVDMCRRSRYKLHFDGMGMDEYEVDDLQEIDRKVQMSHRVISGYIGNPGTSRATQKLQRCQFLIPVQT